MKNRYISLMAKALGAYTDAHIVAYFERVKREGLTEHGFPRLTANIGILISHGYRPDLLPLFLEMMDFCCHQIPRVKAANDFSVREIVCCIGVVEEKAIAPAERIAKWKAELAAIDPYTCYTRLARVPTDKVFNWALFTAVSEHMRNIAGLGNTAEFIDIQIASQLQWLDENGMYRDSLDHPPMNYDLVPRGLFSLLLHFGYRGKYREKIDNVLRKAELFTLRMQSVTGEIPFGGRSNQFLYNEAWLAAIFEFAAKRYQKEGNLQLAGKFKAAACRAVDAVALWLDKDPIYHIKNRFPTESKYGCEGYAYFDKYMITVASNLHDAYLMCDDTILPAEFDISPMTWQTSDHFHKVFLRAGGYALEFDTAADPHYDASGLGRVHKVGAPSAICMSVPCPNHPKYTVDTDEPVSLSLCPGMRHNGVWLFATGEETAYEVTALSHSEADAKAEMRCRFANGNITKNRYTVSENGVLIEISGKGEVAHLLPAFAFDGERETEITVRARCLEIRYQGYLCRYTTDGEIMDLQQTARNRNGYYRAFAATGVGTLQVKIEILPL